MYDYFHTSKIGNIRREAVFRGQEFLLKKEFDFDNGQLKRWKLGHSVGSQFYTHNAYTDYALENIFA